jgi:hypothetical protein
MNNASLGNSAMSSNAGALNRLNRFKSNPMAKWFILGGIIIIVIILIIIGARAASGANQKNIDEPLLIGPAVNAHTINSQVPDGFDIKASDDGLEFSYSVWIFVHDWDYKLGEYKNIFLKGSKTALPGANTASAKAPGLWLYPNTNSLHARIDTYNSGSPEGCDLTNIPLQKWVHLVYVLNNRTVDMYVDGKLERSCILKGVPKLNEDKLHVCTNGGFMGQISKLQYYRRALKPDEIYNIYYDGPMLSSKYQVSFFKDGKLFDYSGQN